MEKVKSFYQSMGFIITFILMCVIISATLGAKFLDKFLLLVLTSQLLINGDIAIKLFNKLTVKTDI